MKTPTAILIGATILSFVLTRAVSAEPLEDARSAETRHDYATALRIIRPLAERGVAAAQYELGDLYYNGWGVPQVGAEAVKWYRRAALQGHPAAQHMLALSYEYGKGVTRNMAESLKWLRRAAEQGYAYSQNRLGQMYESPGRFGVTFAYLMQRDPA
jgi:TPR repeat protein